MTIASRLKAALAADGATDLLVGDLTDADPAGARPAAVLIAITDRAEPGVILTVRRDDMRTHAGQIAFPGGSIDPGENATQAALREAWEELGLDPAEVDPIAAIDPYRTITGFAVTPVIGVIRPDLPLAPHEREVADWFEAPLAFLLEPANQRRQSVLFQGARRHYYEIEWDGRRIWGATAAMLVNLARRLRW